MSSLKTSFLAALAAVLVTASWLAFIQHRREVEAERLRATNGQLRFQASLRRMARTPVVSPSMPNEVAELADARSMIGTEASTTTPIPTGDYRNEGQGAPHATLQTLAWACDRGDSETVVKLLCFDGAGRAKAEAFMAALPEKARAPWNSPEEMASALLTSANMHSPFPSAAILEKATIDPISEGRVMLRLPDTPKDRTEYQKTGDGWKYVITEAAVDAYVARAKAEQAAAH